ncbi:MAG: MarR family transcriptional regulator [Solirubrobacteraceae bacterium]|jgi:DNA-binding MarR family transcriptional regulator
MPATTDTDQALLASELRVVIGQLVRRLRAEKLLPLTHNSVLSRLERCGPASASDLAAAEKMRPQSMAQTLGELEEHGYITRTPDLNDKRRVLVTIADAGLETLAEYRRKREGWLALALAELSSDEQRTLAKALAVMRRLAER